jgi:D-alanyl-D-alanine dipeptidase
LAQSRLPADFVYLRDVDPGIDQDIRYAGSNNFVGRPLAGYGAAECVLRADVAVALKRVQADLAAAGLGLRVHDCYRPRRAVADMVQWTRDGQPDGSGKRFYPKIGKLSLLSGYISANSLHSSGTAVDLSLVRVNAKAARGAPSTAPCTASAIERGDDGVDMGTGFDCFDARSHTTNIDISPEQRQARMILHAAMERGGFMNYAREWWHFAYVKAPRGASYDVPIPPR